MALGVKIAVAIATKIAEKDRTATSIRIFGIKGTDVTMTKGKDTSVQAKVKLALADGYTVTTGKNSYCWLDLDEKTMLKMDQNSKIQVSRTPLRKLLVSVLKGSITKTTAAELVKDGILKVESDLEAIRKGPGVGMAIRG